MFSRPRGAKCCDCPKFLNIFNQKQPKCWNCPKKQKKNNSRGLLKAAWTPRVSGNWVFWVFWDSYSILAVFDWKYWEIWDSHSILHPWAWKTLVFLRNNWFFWALGLEIIDFPKEILMFWPRGWNRFYCVLLKIMKNPRNFIHLGTVRLARWNHIYIYIYCCMFSVNIEK